MTVTFSSESPNSATCELERSPQATAVPEVQTKTNRLPLVDAIRLMCAAWVMWIHIPQSEELRSTTAFGRFRLPTFVILSVLFLFMAQKNHPQRTYKEYVLARLRVIYLPFVAWSVIYLIFDYTLHMVTGIPFDPVSIGILVNGHTNHLWFLPFILVVGFLMFPIARWMLSISARARLVIPITILVGLGASAVATPIAYAIYRSLIVGMNHELGARDTVYRAVTLLPCVPVGVGVYYLFQRISRLPSTFARNLSISGAVLLLACITFNCFRPTNTVLECTAGIALVLIAFAPVHNRVLLWLAQWGRFSYGVYLVHMIYVSGFVILRQFVFKIPPAPWYDIVTLGSCIALSLTTAILLGRSRYTRWLVAGCKPSPQSIDTGEAAPLPRPIRYVMYNCAPAGNRPGVPAPRRCLR
jgi:hypothetical protein